MSSNRLPSSCTMASAGGDNPLLVGLMQKNVEAHIVDFDHYRIHGGMAVETDYIVSIKPKLLVDGVFDAFKISKTYSAFRTLASQLKKAVEKTLRQGSQMGREDKNMVNFVQSVEHLIEAQKTRYLGKVNFNYVKSLSKQRAQILNDTLEVILSNFPSSMDNGSTSTRAVVQIIQNFFLTDHVEDDDDADYESRNEDEETVKTEKSANSPMHSSHSSHIQSLNPIAPLRTIFKLKSKSAVEEDHHTVLPPPMPSPVVPITRKVRSSVVVRTQIMEHLAEVGEDATLLMDDDRSSSKLVPSYAAPVPTVAFAEGNQLGNLIENSPFIFLGIFVTAVVALKASSLVSVTIDFDIALLIAFAMFCVGLHMPRPSQQGIDTPAVVPKPAVSFAMAKTSRSPTAMLRRSLLMSPKATMNEAGDAVMAESEHMAGQDDPLIKSPMDMFPAGAKLGSHLNCWSVPNHESFLVRGPNYLEDQKKIPSGEFLFPARGVDLFLTDACPENIGSNSGILGGALREKPTFLVNFRLPWGVFVCYFEIPERFIPFIRKRYEFDYDGVLPDIRKMSAADRCAARFLQADEATKNKLLKIVPVVVEGPWIVKSVVGGKPAIIGNKLPVNYVYEPASGKKALYLEADLDIVSSSAARGILSVARSHTQVLTLDLGFVVQANQKDELPEQMLVGVRNHGIDPLTASPLPPMKNQFLHNNMDDDSSLLDDL